MNPRLLLKSATLALATAMPGILFAGDPVIDRHVFAAGGGTAEGGGYRIDSTLGEPVAGLGTIPGGRLDSGFRATLAAVIIDGGSAFDEWIANPHRGKPPPPDQRAPGDTPANDGVKNLVKYALGLPPMEPAANAVPTVWTDPKSGALGIVTERWTEAAVEFTVLGSPDMENWTEHDHDVWVLDPDAGDDRERLFLEIGDIAESEPAYFLKLRIRPEPE